MGDRRWTALYIFWQDDFLQDGYQIINEQHRGVLATINSLYYFLQQGHGVEALVPTIKILLQYIQFHSKTEEGILREKGYKDLDVFLEQAERDVNQYKKACREALACKDPQLLLLFLRDWWQRHLQRHQAHNRFMK
jgi:hemerythrin